MEEEEKEDQEKVQTFHSCVDLHSVIELLDYLFLAFEEL
jgi:hypothetical protein